MVMDKDNPLSFGWTLVALGTVFGWDQCIGYSLIGAGVIVSILYWMQSRNGDKSR
jgi:hypothetical protein